MKEKEEFINDFLGVSGDTNPLLNDEEKEKIVINKKDGLFEKVNNKVFIIEDGRRLLND